MSPRGKYPSRSQNTKRYGDLGEGYAVKLLKKEGYRILERNYRGRFGEIDIIAKDNDTLVFVEVKTRWSKKYGKPEEAVNKRKLKIIKKVGELYSLTHPTLPKKLRIEVVAIEVEMGKVTSVKLIKAI